MGLNMDISSMEDFGVKYFSALVLIVVASSTLLENLAKTAEVKSNVVRQEKFLDAAFLNKILGAVLAIALACFTFGFETFWMFAGMAIVFLVLPFIIFMRPSARREAAYAELESEVAATKRRNEMIDALIAAESLRTAADKGDEDDDAVLV